MDMLHVAMIQGTRLRDLKLYKGNLDHAPPQQGCLLASSVCADAMAKGTPPDLS